MRITWPDLQLSISIHVEIGGRNVASTPKSAWWHLLLNQGFLITKGIQEKVRNTGGSKQLILEGLASTWTLQTGHDHRKTWL